MSILILTLLGSVLFSAQDLDIARSAPTSVEYGEEVRVDITLENNLERAVDARVCVPNVLREELVWPKENLFFVHIPDGLVAAVPPYLEWNLTIGPLEDKTVSYSVRPMRVGTYSLSRIEVFTAEGIYKEPPLRTVVTCNSIQCVARQNFPVFAIIAILAAILAFAAMAYLALRSRESAKPGRKNHKKKNMKKSAG